MSNLDEMQLQEMANYLLTTTCAQYQTRISAKASTNVEELISQAAVQYYWQADPAIRPMDSSAC